MLTKLAILTTRRCNLHCAHCLRGYPEERRDFPLELLPHLLEDARPFGVRHVALTGGEPGLHPRFAGFVDKIVAAGYTWNFVTNGLAVEPYLAPLERFKENLTHISLSLDGANHETHDAIRCRQGAFAALMQSIDHYKTMGVKLRFNATINRLNKGELQGMVKLAECLGVDSVFFGSAIPTPWNEKLVLTDQETLEVYKQLKEIGKKAAVLIRSFSSLHTRGGVNFCGNLNLEEITINAKGEVIFCCDTIKDGAVVGSLASEPFTALVRRWLQISTALQLERLDNIATGMMDDGFDACTFCNNFLKKAL
jgi:MoaA/NifB/PqqE/SkfB family radical SAM enzyme